MEACIIAYYDIIMQRIHKDLGASQLCKMLTMKQKSTKRACAIFSKNAFNYYCKHIFRVKARTNTADNFNQIRQPY